MVRLGFQVFFLFAACAASQVTPSLPGTYGSGEPLPPPVAPEPGNASPSLGLPAGGTGASVGVPDDPGAEADFRDAKTRFDAGDREGARQALEAFMVNHPQHPFGASVDLMRARLALLRGEARAAKALLAPLVAQPSDGGIASSARYYLGLAEVQLGQLAQGRELLLPFLPPAGATGPTPETLVELRGALAEATAGVGELPAALELFDGYARGGREPEKAYARARATEIAAELSPDAALRAYRSASERGLSRAALGAKAAALLRAQGDQAAATTIDNETADARHELGMDEGSGTAQSPSGPGDPSRLGLALALSGKFQPVGEAALRAALLATGALSAGAPFGLFLRDVGPEPDRAVRGVAELARDEAVIGIVAANDRPGATATLGAASDNGLPTLALDDTAPGAASTAFGLIHAPEARIASLARASLKLGARDFGIVGPDSAAGTRMREAFRREVIAGGGRITAEASYAPGATSFGAVVAVLKRTPPQAVFVADGADRLELVAPAFAAADLWPAPWGSPRPSAVPGKPRPRTVLLLSTANDLSPHLLQSAGRYVQGALLSPGFYPAAGDARAQAFVESYRAIYGVDPHAVEAYAFDGVNVFRTVTAAGARTRTDVLKALGGGTFEGLTGSLRFSVDHGRGDPPPVYIVDGDEIRAWH